MIPFMVEKYLRKATGDVLRYDPKSAEIALKVLGVAIDSEFAEFYLRYQGCFGSPRPVAELLDIEGPAIPAIPDQTDYVHDRYDIPACYLALTSDESEGMYLYNIDDGSVYDLDIGKLQKFLDGKIPARWKTFNDFLTWYFDDEAAEP